MRILVCGGRNFDNSSLMSKTLKKYFNGPGDVLIHGCAKGADQLAEDVILFIYGSLGTIPGIERYPAEWSKYGKSAGPIRNKKMLDEGKPDLVIAFPGNRGTANMVQQAKDAGVKVVEITDWENYYGPGKPID
jgi:YspA, cpYpsA-related SLOG family